MAPVTTTPRRPGRPKVHPIHQYFNYDEARDQSICILSDCQKKKVTGQHSGNLEKHLRRWHKDKVPTFEKRLKEYSSLKSKKKSNKLHRLNVVMSPRQLKLACVRLVAVHGRPFELVNDGAFQSIIKPYLDAFPARERFSINDEIVRNLVTEEAARLRTYIKEEVKGKLLSLKVDSSKKDGRPFFGVNVQFSNNGEIQLRTLAVRELHVSQSAHNLKEEIMKILDLYDIELGNIVSFTSDNGSNMLRAADLLRTDQEEQHMIIDEDQEDIDLYVEEGNIKLQSIKCAAHTLQLAVMDDSIKTEKDVISLFSQCRQVVKVLRTETYRKKLKKAHHPVPVLDAETRWNTSYTMLESLYKVKIFIEDEECVSDFNEDTWNNIQSVLESLEPTMVATKIFQGEQLTLGDMFGSWLECKVKLRNVGSPLATKIVEAMEKRERRELFAQSNRLMAGQDKVPPLFDHPGFAAAIFLDPRYFSILEENEILIAKSYISNLWSKIEKNSSTAQNENSPEVDGVAEEDSDDNDAVSAMLRERDSLRNLSSSSNVDLTSQMHTYFRDTPRIKDRKSSILKWWEERKLKYPELYEVAKVVHAIPATQVSVERLFSALRFVMHYLRSNLTGQMIEDLVLILNNSHLVKEDILVLVEKDSPESDSDEEEISESSSSLNVSTSASSSTSLSITE